MASGNAGGKGKFSHSSLPVVFVFSTRLGSSFFFSFLFFSLVFFPQTISPTLAPPVHQERTRHQIGNTILTNQHRHTFFSSNEKETPQKESAMTRDGNHTHPVVASSSDTPLASSSSSEDSNNHNNKNHKNLSIFSQLPSETLQRSLPPTGLHEKDAEKDPPYIDVCRK
jgi:hypothetical protein